MRRWTSAYCCWIVSAHRCAVVGCDSDAHDPHHLNAAKRRGRKAKKPEPMQNPWDKANVVPLCRAHHVIAHQMGIWSFQEHHGLDPSSWMLWREWLAMTPGDREGWHAKAYPREVLAE